MIAPLTSCNCGRPALYRATGECQRCYDRRRSAPLRARRAALYRKPCTYAAAHTRVRTARGSARDWFCVRCGKPADQWAYVGDSPREIRAERSYTVRGRPKTATLSWSPDPADYVPLCRTDHGLATRSDYGAGYRHDAAARASYLARQREYHRARFAQLIADPDAHEAYRASKRAAHHARKELEASRRHKTRSHDERENTTPTEGTPK